MASLTDAPELKSRLNEMSEKVDALRGYFDVDSKNKRLDQITMESENPEVWGQPHVMNQLNQERSFLEKSITDYNQLQTKLEDSKVLLEMAVEAEDLDSLLEVVQELSSMETSYQELELKTMLNGETDPNSAYLSINSGAGGTEACDWADMLFRMYKRFADKQSYKVEVVEFTEGDSAGLKSVTLNITGPYAYGNLKAETGVHRLVRISPFDSNARRHTSFTSVFVWPEVDDSIDIEVKTEDIRVDTYRASGAGGQHINKTDSAVRITHEPSGIVVQCQSERSQHANRDKAMKMLKAALYEKELEEKNREKDEMNATKKANEWGSQIRSYVMHPYQMVKDHRTNFEKSQVDSVMDGDLDDFIYAFLKMQASSGGSNA
ncbi:MAG: peptide chain release factor 2 [Bdellovibrionales bacterium]